MLKIVANIFRFAKNFDVRERKVAVAEYADAVGKMYGRRCPVALLPIDTAWPQFCEYIHLCKLTIVAILIITHFPAAAKRINPQKCLFISKLFFKEIF